MMCRHGGGSKKVGEGENLCRFKTTQQKHHERNIPYPQSG